ncbi:MAG TPA: hypothetical protein VGI37_02515 [Streptosporangiaceae bacterium]|jgi:hypothetical protein
MNVIRHFAARRLRPALVTTVAAGAGLAGLLGIGGGVAHASVAHAGVNGYVVTDSCTSVAGKISYSPGLRTSKLKAEHAVLTGTTSGCSDLFNGALPGTGTFTAILSGTASVNAENFSGTFTINWPAGSGFNPSNGTLSVTDANGVETISGTVTSGFDTGSPLALQYVNTHNTGRGTALKPVTAQSYVNTQSLTLSRNTG